MDMIYTNLRHSPELIRIGVYKNFNYYIYSLGTHPCAYVNIGNTSLDHVDYDDIDIQCHGNLTYSMETLHDLDIKGWFIGWDYAHPEDYIGGFTDGIKWTVKEIEEECIDVIEQVIKITKKQDLVLNWYVYREDFNAKEIKLFNIFEHTRFKNEVINLINVKNLTKEEFSDRIRSSLFYCYAFKCEYEVVLTSFPYHIKDNNLTIGKKIDIYQQVMLNFKQFIDYLWSIRNENS